VGGVPRLRTRRPGDRFQPLGMGGHTVKLSDFLTNQKVPRDVRDRLPLLEGEGGIAWVCGQRVDERACVRDGTQRVLLLRFICSAGGA
jgi:tRNA(Ile)-lysidine synthase